MTLLLHTETVEKITDRWGAMKLTPWWLSSC